MARIRRAALIAAAFVVLSCGSPVTMIDGWSIGRSIGRPTTSSDHCDFAGVAQKAFQKAHLGETGSRMQLYEEGSYVASNGRPVSVLRTNMIVVAVFSLEHGRRVALGMQCGFGGAGLIKPHAQSVIDQWAAPRPTK